MENSAGVLMKTYEGKRTIDGIVVTVDGRPLPEHYEVKQFTRFGFEWTYEGESPRQLALRDSVRSSRRQRSRHRAIRAPYMQDVIANLDNDWHADRRRRSTAYLRRRAHRAYASKENAQ